MACCWSEHTHTVFTWYVCGQITPILQLPSPPCLDRQALGLSEAIPIHTPGEQPRLAEATPTAFMDRCGYLNNQGKSEWTCSAPP